MRIAVLRVLKLLVRILAIALFSPAPPAFTEYAKASSKDTALLVFGILCFGAGVVVWQAASKIPVSIFTRAAPKRPPESN